MRQKSGYASDHARDIGPEMLEVLFNLMMADLRLYLLEERLPLLSGAANDLNEGMQMLKSAVQLASVLTDDDHVMTGFVERVHTARQSLNDLAAKRMIGNADRFKLPEASSSSTVSALTPSDVRLPSVALPPPLQRPPAGSVGLGVARSRSAKHLVGPPGFGQGPGMSLTAGMLEDITSWIARGHWTGDQAAQLVLGEVESLLFITASSGAIDSAASTFGADDIVKLEGLVGTYKSVLANFSGRASRMSVELHSRDALVCWIAYAMVFAATRNTLWPLEMESFGVCLRASDLQYLVLSDKLAVDAALKVSTACAFPRKPFDRCKRLRTVFNISTGRNAANRHPIGCEHVILPPSTNPDSSVTTS